MAISRCERFKAHPLGKLNSANPGDYLDNIWEGNAARRVEQMCPKSKVTVSGYLGFKYEAAIDCGVSRADV
jgi:hypothetical protein